MAFFTEHAQQVREILPCCLPQRREFFEFIDKHPELLQQQTELIIILALSSSKTVREKATVLLSQLNQTESQQYFATFPVEW